MIPYAERLRALATATPTPPKAHDSAAVLDTVLEVVAGVLALPAQRLDPDRSFAELGVNSLLAVRLLDRINRAFDLRLGVEVLFSHGDARRLAGHVATLISGRPWQPATTVQPAAPAVDHPAIAVIGYAGKFAGADSPDALWRALLAGRSLLSAMPDFRCHDPAAPAPRAGFLTEAERFDAAFFGLSPREAAAIDPVQRQFLEQAWCALEHAGLTRAALAGKTVGVYAGAAGSGYERTVSLSGKAMDAYVMTGNLPSMTAARLAYFLDLDGPAVTLDTACSSSLMAVHLACRALLAGDIDLAIAGGASLFVDERPFTAMARAGMTSPTGACRPFDDGADGIAVAEAAACVVLKPLAQALADGDRIEAVIRATGANQDGRSNGITAPNALAQAKLLRSVLAQARLDPDSIDLIETHGTGTRLGDPIEAAALREVYGRRAPQQPLRVAALKGCTGHASEAAGISGLIAALLALRHRRFPPLVGFTGLNTHIAQAGGAHLAFSHQAAPWPEPVGHPRRAAVSSFGLSGTNVHLIIEDAPARLTPEVLSGEWLCVLSAASPDDLARRRAALAAWLADQPDSVLPDVAHTLLFHREPMAYRWGTLATSVADLRQQLATEPTADDPRLVAWLAGAAPQADWLPTSRRVPLDLPTYPFRGPRLWGGNTLPDTASAPPHPLLGEYHAEGGFARIFRPDEALVADHRVGGQALLHAAVLLEMGQAALDRLAPGHVLGQLAWLKPLAVEAATPVWMTLADGLLSIAVNDSVHVTARALPAADAPPAVLDPEALWSSLPATADTDVSEGAPGVFLGPAFPGPDRIRADGRFALAFLEHAPNHGLNLPPALLDAAIRTAAAVVAGAEPEGPRLRFPARLDSLGRWAELPAQGFWLKAQRRHAGPARSVEQVDVEVCDRHGQPLLSLCGLTLAAASEPAPSRSTPPPATSWRLLWRDMPVPAHGQCDHEADLIVAGADDRLAQNLAARFPAARWLEFAGLDNDLGGMLAALPKRARIWFLATLPDGDPTLDLLRLLKALATHGRAGEGVVLRIVTCEALAVLPDDLPRHATGAAVLGLGKAAARECPAWRVRLFDLDPSLIADTATPARLIADPGDALGEPVALRGGSRWVPRLSSLSGPADTTAISLVPGAHIILIGGAGRLGQEIARDLARRYGARLSLVGRSAVDAERAALLDTLHGLGGQARYYSADITDPAALASVLDTALAGFGPAALLIQAAVDPAFARIERAALPEFAAALAPKMTGLINLGAAFRDRPIAALAVFSSIGAFSGFPANDGQASYCAACGFEASHGLALMRHTAKPVRIIHWGLWDSGDYPPEALARMRASGLYAMPAAGLGDAFDRFLREPYAQVVHAQLAPGAWLDMGAEPMMPSAPLAEAARTAIAAAERTAEPFADLAQATAQLSQRIDTGLAAVFSARGFSVGESLSRAQAMSRLAVLPRHRGLANALLNMALRRGYAEAQGEHLRWVRLEPPALSAAAPTLPGMRAALRLLDRCLASLPQVLAGELPGTDVLFPEGSMDWVEPIYRDQPILAGCGRRLAAAVVAAVARGGGRILEIGAGTGSTTGPVLDALHAAGLDSRYHYLYTDISRAFTRHGHTRFGARLAGTQVLDIARPPQDQGLEVGAWDIVIASNVLHATPDIRTTLSHVAELLAPGGIALINEMVETDDFATLTFGLLDGWWETQDPECRLADGPILGIAGWRDALRGVGLQGRWAYDHRGTPEHSAGGQALIVAFKPWAETAPRPAAPSMPPAQAVTASPTPADRAELENALRGIIAAILDIPPGQLERDRPFMEIGVDSLIAPQIAEDVQAKLGCPLRVTDIYKHGHLAALAGHLLGSYAGQPRPAEISPEASAVPVDTTRTDPATAPPAPAQADAIAIIGLSMRFAGAPDVEALWTLLDAGQQAITPVDRFDLAPWFDPEGGPNKTYARWGGFLPEYDRFDPYFFNITPAEAEVMDPQQRVLMEEAWKALEHAGIDPDSLSGARCGLFIGASANNYQAAEGSPGLRTLGGSMAILSARMAYSLNLRGPTFPIDTGCSSSLVALHQACQSLRTGECDLALAGGVSVNLISPDIFLYLADAGMASRAGASRTFDDGADGFVPGEGVGVVVLKRLAAALADGDRIDAVIVGTGVNQDGRTAGLTAPSAEAQTALVLDIYTRYGLDPSAFGMIEAHGTGTRLGDPIEVHALTEAFRRYTDRRGGCALGSVKTNIGHTMAAAGMAGIAKAVLALRHGRIPASLNFAVPNRHIDFADSPFFVPTHSTPWPEGRARLAAVSSFGFSGTNAHIVLSASPERLPDPPGPSAPWLFVVSARDGAALQRRLRDLADWLDGSGQTADLARMADTLARGRAHGRYRRGFVAAERAELQAALRQAATEPAPAPVAAGHIPTVVAVQAGVEGLRQALRAYELGNLPDWAALFGPRRPPVVLPAYPFARERFWTMPPPVAAATEGYAVTPAHVLLTAHRVGGACLLPGTLSLELLRGAAPGLADIAWLKPLRAENTPTQLQVVGDDRLELRTADGLALVQGRRLAADAAPVTMPNFEGGRRLSGADLYARFARTGFDYGAALRVIEWVDIGAGAARARLLPPAGLADDPLLMAAALLDGALQTAAAIGHAEDTRVDHGQWVPYRLGALRVWRRPAGVCVATARLEPTRDPDSLVFSVDIRDADGLPLAAFEDMAARRLTTAPAAISQIHAPIWRAAALEPALTAPAVIVMVGGDARLETALRHHYPAAQWLTADLDAAPEQLAQAWANLPGPLLIIHALTERLVIADPPLTLANGLAALDPLPETRVALHLARGLVLAGGTQGARLLTVAAGGTPARLAAATIAGLYRTLRLEAPTLDARVALVEPEVDPAAALIREIAAPPAHDPWTRYEADVVRRVMDWEAVAMPQPASRLPGGTVVITGGLGGIGLALAQRLASEGAVNIALLSRSAPDPDAQTVIQALERSGATVLNLAVDISDPRALAAALATIRSSLGPITAVYHLAGVLRDNFLRHTSAAELAEVFAAKVRGAVLLDLLTRQDPLETFVLFGSTAAVFGSIGQADYGAANAFLAAFADYRQARGDNTLCIAWPLWAEGGMRPPSEAVAYLENLGMLPLSAADGFNLLAHTLATGLPAALALYGRPGLFERLRPITRTLAHAPSLSLAPGAAFHYLCELLAAVTKLPRERIEPDIPFEDLGIDSIAIMKLNRQLELDLGPVAKTLFFEYRTPGALAAHLARAKPRELAAHLHPDQALTPPEPEPTPAPRLDSPPPALDTEAIAIVGIAGIYPMADDLDSFWVNLRDGRDCIREIPPERWPLAGFYDPDRDQPATSHCKWGGFIDGADQFDARFFGISPLEAETLDPQARKFLEVCWHALEDAGLDPERMFDTLPEAERIRRACGVFVGVMYGDYQLFGPEQAQKGNLIGPNADYWNIANRVSAFLDLHGPSMAVDTACSSSLSALHLACQAIRAGECAMAIAGGVNLCLHPRRHWILSKAGMAASDGRCHSFGAGGDGYVPGEGIGAVVLKSLAQARRDGDRIQGIILGSALNHGGRTSGYTVPNPVAQGEAIAAALHRAKIDPRSLSYIEAHGTGTPLGDPIEIRGLARAFADAMPNDCAVGSVKATIGHLESAAGIAGLTKVLLQMRESTLAPTLHADPPNPGLDFSGTAFRIVTRAEPWRGPLPLRAGLSSFGAGGANAHVILEAAPAEATPATSENDDAPTLLCLSARDADGLKRRARQLAEHLLSAQGRRQGLADIAHTLAVGRKAFGQRLAVIGTTREEIAAALRAYADHGELVTGVWTGEAQRHAAPAASPDPAALAAAWVAGASAPDLPGRRVALPGYPFAPRRLWVKLVDTAPSLTATETRHYFASQQAPLADHRIGGRLLLPGASSLRLALDAAGPGLRDIVWPVAGLPTEQGLEVQVRHDGKTLTVLDGAGAHLLEARLAVPDAIPPAPDADTLAARCPERLEAATLYPALASAGAEYGPSLRVLETVWRGEGLCWARLSAQPTEDGVLDAAFQLCFALIPEHLAGAALLPAGLGRCVVNSALTTARTVVASRRAADERGIVLDIHLLDGEGLPVAWLGEFRASVAAVSKPAMSDPNLPPLRILRPEWTPMDPPEGGLPQRAWVVSEEANDPLALALAQAWNTRTGMWSEIPADPPDALAIVLGGTSTTLVEAALRLEQRLATLLAPLQRFAAAARPPALLVLTREAHGPGLDAPGAAVVAFLRAVARERHDWTVIALDLPAALWTDAAHGLPRAVTHALPRHPTPEAAPLERAWRDGLLLRRVLAPILLPSVAAPWRDGEVLVIAGAGGLGGLLARHAASQARLSVAFLGRGVAPNPPTAAAIDRLRAQGRPVLYIQADLADAAAVTTAVRDIQAQLGAIAWIAHTALVMGDAPLADVNLDGLRRVLAPKSLGLAHLAAAVQPSRGLLLFSSSNALTANPGQAAYAAASAFVDTAALSLPYPVHVIDWGFWGETGAVADATHQTQLARLGVLPIRDQEGLDTLERMIGAGLTRAAVLRVADRLLEPMGVDVERAVHWRGTAENRTLAAPATLAATRMQNTASPFADPDTEVLNSYAARRLWLALARLGVPLTVGHSLQGTALAQALAARPDYLPLMDALADLLQRAGLADAFGRSTGTTISAAALAEERRRLETEAPATAPTLRLLETCLEALGEVVAGRREAAAVLFQGGDSAAVAAIYQGNPVVDHFQTLVAAAVAGAVRAAEHPARILEVGAGTGGTTGFVLDALAGLDGWQYRVTDLGAGLATATAARLDPERRWLESGRLDVTQPFTGQGVAAGSIDVLIAANVLHATPDLFEVLANIKEALAPGGLLILNEASSRQDINTLTFGLTPGWWAFRDGRRRCPHGPLLDPARWSQVLAEAGFTVSACLGLPLARGGEHPLQSVIIAVADGYAPDPARRAPASAAVSKAAPTVTASGPSDLEHSLRQLIADTLRLDLDELGVDDSFADHGADSILSVELVRRINASYAIDLKSTALFNYATVRELAAYMAREHGVGGRAAAPDDRPKRQAQRLMEVINRRREAAPVNREAEFWQRQTGETPPPAPEPAAPADLDEVLRRLERGDISVSQALELHYVDE